MKSLLQEAPSISKAIEKAWVSAGNPTEFTIKILDTGEKNFFGMAKQPAIVSIIYNLPKQPKSPQRQKTEHKKYHQKLTPKTHTETKKEFTNPKPAEHSKKREYSSWKDEFIQDITLWIKEIKTIINIPLSFNTKIEKKTLTIIFANPVLAGIDEERLLFSGLSYLLIQFLKKKHRKKLLGYRLIITSKQPNTNNK